MSAELFDARTHGRREGDDDVTVVLTDVTAKTLSIVDATTDTVKKTLPLPTLN